MTLKQLRRETLQLHLIVIACYILAALAFTWPLAAHMASDLPGSPDGDTGVYVWNQWVFQHEVLDQRTIPYFTGKIFAATGRANLSLHNYTTFANLLALPLVRFIGVVSTFNAVYLALTVLTAYATFLLGLRLTDGDATVSWLAGLLFAWSPVLVTRGMGHFSLVAAAPLPFFIMQLLQLRQRPSRRSAIALGSVVAWATACDVYYGVYCVMMATAYLLGTSFRVTRSDPTPTGLSLITRGVDLLVVSVGGLLIALLASQGWQFTVMNQVVRVRTIYTPALVLTSLLVVRVLLHLRPRVRPVSVEHIRASLRTLATAGIVSVILMSPLLYAFGVRVLEGRVDRQTILWRSSPPGIDALALVVPNPNHPLAPAALRQWLSNLSSDGYLENVASIPLVAIVVILIAWRVGWRAPWLVCALTIGFGVLALGPFLRVAGVDTHIPVPWALARYVPIFGLARSPARFFIPAMLGIAAMFALALRALLARWPAARRPIVAGVAVLLVLELLPAPRTLYSAEIPSIYDLIAADPRADVRVLELPFGIRDGTMSVGNFTSRTQFYQTAHRKAIVGGYVSRISRRRVLENRRDNVLGALIRLSEGDHLSQGELEGLRSAWPEFIRRTSVAYIVLDRQRAPDDLQFVTEMDLGLEKLADAPPLTLYRPVTTLE